MTIEPREPSRSLQRRSSRGAIENSPIAAAGRSSPERAATTVTFEQVFDEHYERLVRTLTVVAGSRDAAADAVQDAFVKAHLKWQRISRYDDPAGWIRRVAINRLRNEHRSTERKWRAIRRLGTRPQPTDGQPEIDEFGRLLAQLPRQQRLSVALFYVDHLTIAEIAATL
ncbi:MAG: hypothetical protein HKN41_03750, partial [Ilumatobacter sp.]|nr:hypothetical protein [Ilumatobacter sp.]